jgi:hypothetical protein
MATSAADDFDSLQIQRLERSTVPEVGRVGPQGKGDDEVEDVEAFDHLAEHRGVGGQGDVGQDDEELAASAVGAPVLAIANTPRV